MECRHYYYCTHSTTFNLTTASTSPLPRLPVKMAHLRLRGLRGIHYTLAVKKKKGKNKSGGEGKGVKRKYCFIMV